MSRPSAATRLMSDSGWNLAAFAISVLSNIIALPFAIAAIGLDQFGKAGLVLAAFAPFSVLGAILGQSLVRGLASSGVREELPIGRRMITLAALWCAVGCVIVACLAVVIGPWALDRLEPQSQLSPSYLWALYAGYGAWFCQQWCFLAQGVLGGRQSFKKLALANAAGGLVLAISIVVSCRLMGTAAGFLLGSAFGFAVQIALLTGAVMREAPRLLIPNRWHASDVESLRGFFGWQGSAHFAGSVANQCDRYVLGATASAMVVGQYNIAMRVQEVIHMGVLKMGEVLLPHFSATASEPSATRSIFFQRATWIVNVLSVAALAPLIPLGPALIALWVDGDAAVLGGPMLQTLATAGVLGSGINVFTFFALGTGQAERLATINLAHSLVLVVLAIPLILLIGPLAAGWAYVAGNLMRWCATFWFSLDHFGQDLRFGQLALASASPWAAGLLVGWGLASLGSGSVTNWWALGLSYGGIGALIVACAMLIAATTTDGRRWLLSLKQVGLERIQRQGQGR